MCPTCIRRAAYSVYPKPPLTGNICWGYSNPPTLGAQNCSAGVCKACCNQKLDATECDMCVQRMCQNPGAQDITCDVRGSCVVPAGGGLPNCKTCQNRCSQCVHPPSSTQAAEPQLQLRVTGIVCHRPLHVPHRRQRRLSGIRVIK